MKARLHLTILLCFIVLAGCQQNVYELELTPDGEQLHRKLVCYRVDHRSDAMVVFPDKELERIRAVYPEGPTSPTKLKHTFESLFERNTPQDIGGAGYYLTFDSPVGRLCCYAERFRGTDDMAVQWLGRPGASSFHRLDQCENHG